MVVGLPNGVGRPAGQLGSTQTKLPARRSRGRDRPPGFGGSPLTGQPVSNSTFESDSLTPVTEQQPRNEFERGTDGPKVIVAGVDGSDSSYAGRGLRGRSGPAAERAARHRLRPARDAGRARRSGCRSPSTTDEIAEELVAEIRAAHRAGQGHMGRALGVPHLPRRPVQRAGAPRPTSSRRTPWWSAPRSRRGTGSSGRWRYGW